MSRPRVHLVLAMVATALGIVSTAVVGAGGAGGTGGSHIVRDTRATRLAQPTAQELLSIIRRSSVLRKAVEREAPKLGMDPARLMAITSSGAAGESSGQSTEQTQEYPLGPIDWVAGLWLTFDRPVAAATWPAAQFAMASFTGAGWEHGTLLLAQNAQDLAGILPMSGAAPMHTTDALNSKVCVTLKTPEVALYVVALCLLHDPGANEFHVAAGNLALSAAAVDGNKVVAIVRSLAPSGPSPIMGHLVFRRLAQGPWRVAGVSVKRLTY